MANVYICSDRNKKGDVSRLLNGSLESYYWLGYLLADGGFTENKRLKLVLGKEDQHQVKAFCEYLGKDYKGKYSASFMSKDVVPKICSLLGISDRHPKTYNGCNLDKIKCIPEESRVALFVGFIDGDGSIQYQTNRSTTKISVKLHSSWLEFLKYMQKDLHRYFSETFLSAPHINSKGYAYMSIGSFSLQKSLKRFVEVNKLPVLCRKWSKIDVDLEILPEKLDIQRAKVLKLVNYGVPARIISDTTEINISFVNKVIREISHQ